MRLLAVTLLWMLFSIASGGPESAAAIEETSARVVKIYGAGGLGRIEAYGTGLVVSPTGHILTVLSPMLHGSPPRVIFADGKRRTAKLVATDMTRELALLKVDAADELPCWNFDLEKSVSHGQVQAELAEPGTFAFAFSNSFGVAAGDEPVSVQRGIIAAVAPIPASNRQRSTRRQEGELYILDISTSNPGAAGGAVVSSDGQLLGMIGKELQDPRTGVWVNYALPATLLRDFVLRGMSGRDPGDAAREETHRDRVNLRALDLRGIETLPEVLEGTPPFVDGVAVDSPARSAGLRPDDLILFVGEQQVRNIEELRLRFADYDADKPIPLTVLRDDELTPLELPPRGR